MKKLAAAFLISALSLAGCKSAPSVNLLPSTAVNTVLLGSFTYCSQPSHDHDTCVTLQQLAPSLGTLEKDYDTAAQATDDAALATAKVNLARAVWGFYDILANKYPAIDITPLIAAFGPRP